MARSTMVLTAMALATAAGLAGSTGAQAAPCMVVTLTGTSGPPPTRTWPGPEPWCATATTRMIADPS